MGTVFNLIFNLNAAKAGITVTKKVAGTTFTQDITIDVVIREFHDNKAIITKNPIENGSVVSDHVEVQPVSIIFDGVLSDNPLTFPVIQNVVAGIRTVSTLFGNTRRSVDLYNSLLDLQNNKQEFTVTTGYKTYKNMFLESITAPRTASNKDAVIFTAKMSQLLFVESKKVNVGQFSDDVKDLASPLVDKGSKVTDVIPIINPDSTFTSSITSATSVVKSPSAFAGLLDKAGRVFG